jgi:thiosulfate dehydrogenase
MYPDKNFVRAVYCLNVCVIVIVVTMMLAVPLIVFPSKVDAWFRSPAIEQPVKDSIVSGMAYWQAPDSTKISQDLQGDLIRYGRELVAHTAIYLGPKGTVMQISNGMNCQNCHLKSGKKNFGNNYSAVASTYPKYRARSGGIETVEKRVNDCIERSLNGMPLPLDSWEMKAIKSYILWVGSNVQKNHIPKGSGLKTIPFLDRAADPVKGKIVFEKHCVSCHGKNGEGEKKKDGIEWLNPPLWGDESYNTGAGIFRLSRFAGYVKANMPNGATFEKPILTDEEAWDVAAYVNSLPRPKKSFANDWPDISEKPFDHPFGPYADTLSERRHKYGPFVK